MREHCSKSKFYMLVARNAFQKEQTAFVDFGVQLPGLLKKAKFIFYMQSESEQAETDDNHLRGDKMRIIEEFELRKFCDVFYE